MNHMERDIWIQTPSANNNHANRLKGLSAQLQEPI